MQCHHFLFISEHLNLLINSWMLGSSIILNKMSVANIKIAFDHKWHKFQGVNKSKKMCEKENKAHINKIV